MTMEKQKISLDKIERQESTFVTADGIMTSVNTRKCLDSLNQEYNTLELHEHKGEDNHNRRVFVRNLCRFVTMLIVE